MAVLVDSVLPTVLNQKGVKNLVEDLAVLEDFEKYKRAYIKEILYMKQKRKGNNLI